MLYTLAFPETVRMEFQPGISVWHSLGSIKKHAEYLHNGLVIFGVDADWARDTKPLTLGRRVIPSVYRELTKPSRVIRPDEIETWEMFEIAAKLFKPTKPREVIYYDEAYGDAIKVRIEGDHITVLKIGSIEELISEQHFRA